jgi:hypothetical protein
VGLDQIKDLILIVAAGISAVGIPTLVALIWRYHKAQVEALRLFTFKEVDAQISALEGSYTRVNRRLREYAAELERQKFDVPEQEIEDRLSLLRQAIAELHNMGFVNIPGRGADSLKTIMGYANYEHMEKAKTALDALVALEGTLKKRLGPDVVEKVENELQGGQTD